jgi:glycosyltransferase involved in cell wall biosynthesis
VIDRLDTQDAASGKGGVTAITLTRHRPQLVQRAIASVQAQRTTFPVHHLVLVDDCRETEATLRAYDRRGGALEILFMSRKEGERSGPARSSRLRNFGVRRATTRWIAFLDDDNEWTPDHLQALVECALAHGTRAAHSHVALLHRDGRPYLEPLWPWAHTREEAALIYAQRVAQRVIVPGSNVVGGDVDLHEPPRETPDTSSLLLERDLLLEVPFEETFTEDDARDFVGEDVKLFRALVARREPLACTRRPTLRYRLGGYSNDRSYVDETFSWASAGRASAG